jgi:hypothetical protein
MIKGVSAMISVRSGIANKVVVARLDGQRLKGHVYNFSMAHDSFRLFPEDDTREHAGLEIRLKDLKAIFFVKEFSGHPERHDRTEMLPHGHGRVLQVTFADGEKIAGTTEAFNPRRPGFFLFPLDQDGNNTRIFVVNSNAADVKQI